jgi:protein-tyrosine-phosphatase
MADQGREASARVVLFLCTGNYYRSRFAEALFNAAARAAGLDWRAESRGLALERGVGNVGPMSACAAGRLAELGVPAEGCERFPLAAREEDLARADRVVAVKEAEHRPLLQERFPGWEGRVTYWHVHDVEDAPPAQALAEVEREVRALVEELAARRR